VITIVANGSWVVKEPKDGTYTPIVCVLTGLLVGRCPLVPIDTCVVNEVLIGIFLLNFL
jgi:hypothetical protein